MRLLCHTDFCMENGDVAFKAGEEYDFDFDPYHDEWVCEADADGHVHYMDNFHLGTDHFFKVVVDE